MDKEQHSMCNCGGHNHHLLRWLLGMLILVLVFWMGMEIGEFKGSLGGEGFGGSRHMRFNKPMMENGWDAHNMMYFNSPAAAPKSATSTKAK